MMSTTVQRKATDLVSGLSFEFRSARKGLLSGKIRSVKQMPATARVRIEYRDADGVTKVLIVKWDARITVTN